MSKGFTWAQAANSAAHLAVLLLLGSGDLLAQQRLGRQQDLTTQQVDSLRSQIQQLDGRAIIGFKPVDAEQGMLPEGTPGLVQSTVRFLAESLSPMGVVVLRQFQRIPAVAVRMDPSRFEELLANPNIDYVEPDVLHDPTGVPEIPDLTGTVVQEIPWGIDRVKAPAAWSITKGAGAKLGIIDTGIDENHPDLNVIDGINLVTGGTLRSDWDDNSPICITHGTHVAGSAAALDNDLNVVGVAPEAELYALRVFDPENSGSGGCFAFTSDIIAALEWAVDNTMDVVNLSLGSFFPSISEADAVFATYSAGVVVVAAAGNSGSAVGFPAAFPHAIAVAAIDIDDDVAWFSDRGPEVEVAGPGVDVLSTWGGGGTEFLQGTSMATPHAAGVATLIRAARPGLGADDVRQILHSTADDILGLGYDLLTGYGVVDAAAAVNSVAGGDPALSLVPGDVLLAVEPGGAPVSELVEIRNVGGVGTINWDAGADASWIVVDPISGIVTDVAPGQLRIDADPTGLTPGLYTGFVTVTGNAANSPAQIRVRFAVMDAIPLDATVATAGEIQQGDRTRYRFAGTAGQDVDIAVLTDTDHPQPLSDPIVRLYKSDGTTVLDLNDDGWFAGLGFQSLIYAFRLPEDGDYIVEVGAYSDASGGGFIVKARETGPILATLPGFSVGVQAEEGGEPGETVVSVYNLTGVGTINFTVTTSEAWLSALPESGTASASRSPMARVGQYTTGPDQDRRVRWGERPTPPSLEPEKARPWAPGELAQRIGVEGASALEATVTITADPAGLSAGSHFGSVIFEPSDGWLSANVLSVNFRVYTSGMQIISEGHLLPLMITTDTPDQAIGATSDAGGSLIPIAADGTLNAPVATGFVRFPGGLTTGQDGNWYVGSRVVGDFRILKVRRDGNFETFVTMPDNVFWMATGPGGEFYPSMCFADQLYRVSVDGSVIEPFGPTISCPLGVAFNAVHDAIYVGSAGDDHVRVIGLDGSDLGLVALNVRAPRSVAVGRSGKVYQGTFFGEVWVYDPSTGGDAQFLGFAPTPYSINGMTLVEGALLMAEQSFGQFYRFPVDDGPPGTGDIAIRMAADDIVNLAGLAKSIPGEDFRIPLNIEISPDATAVANYTLELSWDVARLDFLDLAQGDFTTGPGTFVANTATVSEGSLVATGAEPDGRGAGGGNFALFTLDLVVDESLGAGDVVGVLIDATEVGGALNEDLLPLVVVVHGQICLSLNPMGDMTLDGRASAADATQVLRHIVGLPLAPDIDLDRGDVTGDGDVGVGDVVDILRNLVGLQVPASSRVDKPPLESCS